MLADITLTLPNQMGALQISLVFAILIVFAVALTGVLIGIWCGWFLTGRDLRRTRTENDKLREARDVAQAARTKALNERERAMRDLQGKLHEYSLLEAEHLSLKRQYEQTQGMLSGNDQRINELSAMVDALRTQADELRGHLLSREEALNDRQQLVARLTQQLGDMSNRYAEAQQQATERHVAMATASTELAETKAKLDQAYETIADMQASLSALASNVQQRRTRLVDANGESRGIVVEVANGAIGMVESYGNTVNGASGPNAVPAQSTLSSAKSINNAEAERLARLEQQAMALLAELRSSRS